MGWSRTLTIDLGLGTGKFKADPDPWSTAFGKGAQAGTRTIVRTHTHDIAAALQGKTEYHKMRTRGFKVLDKVIPFAGDALRPSALAGAFFVCDSPLNRYSCRAQAPNGVGCRVPCTRVLVFSRKSRMLSRMEFFKGTPVAGCCHSATRRVKPSSTLSLWQMLESLPRHVFLL